MRRALLLALALVSVACGATGSGRPIADGGTTGRGGASGGSGGAGGSAAQCQVDINPVPPTSFTGLMAGADTRLRVRGDVTGLPATSFRWSWHVTLADGKPVPVTQVGTELAVVEFAAPAAGTYTISVDLVGMTACGGRRTVLVAQPGARLASFRFRFTPPAGGDPVQEKELQVLGATPSGGSVIVLAEGQLVVLDTRDATTMAAAPAYVRLTDPAQGLTIEARCGVQALPGLRLPPGTFDVLIVPDGDLAPVLLAGRRAADLANMGPVMLTRGAPVTGIVTDAGAGGARRPVADARVVLRAGALPSTLATTGADGRFTVRALPGTYGATVTLPVARLMMEATLPAVPGLQVPAAGVAGFDVEIGSATTASMDVRGLPAETRLLLTSEPLPNLVRLGGAAVSPRLRGEVTPPAGGGTLTLAGLPRSRYSATAVPASLGTTDAITRVGPIDLLAGDAVAQVTMSPRVPLSGTLLPAARAGGIPLVAVDVTDDLTAAIAAVTDTQGRFLIEVSPARRYSLRVRPGLDRALAPLVFEQAVGATGVALGDQRLPEALLYAGQVRDHFGTNGSPSTLVQVYCLAGTAACADPVTPVAETVTASDGTFALQLPDPGVQ